MRISFTGPGCSGKTTLLKKCQEHYGDEFEYVEEVTRPALKEGMKINEDGDNKTQLYVLAEHLKNDKLDNVIMDRCIIDGFVYTTWLHMERKVDESVLNAYTKVYSQLIDNLDIVFACKPVKLEDDGERSTDSEFIEGVKKVFENVVRLEHQFSKVSIIYLEGDVETRFNDIKIAIQKHERTSR